MLLTSCREWSHRATARPGPARKGAAIALAPRASNVRMPRNPVATVRKATSADLEVGLICADRDGNRIRIDHVDRPAGEISYHFLNDELRVQEGIQQTSIERFVSEGWRVAAGGGTL
jgi:hypothetical protein